MYELTCKQGAGYVLLGYVPLFIFSSDLEDTFLNLRYYYKSKNFHFLMMTQCQLLQRKMILMQLCHSCQEGSLFVELLISSSGCFTSSSSSSGCFTPPPAACQCPASSRLPSFFVICFRLASPSCPAPNLLECATQVVSYNHSKSRDLCLESWSKVVTHIRNNQMKEA